MEEQNNAIESPESLVKQPVSLIENIINKIKSKSGESTIILFVSLLPYFVTYYYQIGYLHHYGLSSEFADFSIPTLLKDTIFSILIASLMMILMRRISETNTPKSLKTIVIVELRFISFLALLILVCIFSSESLNMHFLGTFIISIVCFFIAVLLTTLVIFRIYKGYKKFEKRLSTLWSRLKSWLILKFKRKTTTSKKERRKPDNLLYALFLLFLFISILWFITTMGGSVASSKTSYMSFTDEKNRTYLVVSNFKDGVLAVEYKGKGLLNSSRYVDIKEIGTMTAVDIQGIKASSSNPWYSPLG